MKKLVAITLLSASMLFSVACGFDSSMTSETSENKETISSQSQNVNGADWMACLRKCSRTDHACHQACNEAQFPTKK